jgi:hypothetical protein
MQIKKTFNFTVSRIREEEEEKKIMEENTKAKEKSLRT